MPKRAGHHLQLAALPLFSGTNKAELQRARSLLTLVTVDSGNVLIRQGGVGDEFLIVVEGLVEVTRSDAHQSQVVAVATAGDVLGEMSLLHRAPCSATVTTVTPTTVYAASPSEFFTLMEAVRPAAQRIRHAATSRLNANLAA